ncbi:MAG: glycosyltransferase family 4 protein [Candidatus Contendobacter sp.]|nr:glycosyltransferase family 4 protein [Candidatus Contendobacter sp.]
MPVPPSPAGVGTERLPPRRLLINDHAGHPFQVQLSRALAARGHTVLHTYTENLLTPRGDLKRGEADPPSFAVEPLVLSRPFQRYGLLRRVLQERELGCHLVDRVRAFRPDLVVSANTPLGAQQHLLRACRAQGIGFVFWLQDLLGVGINSALSRKLPLLGAGIGHYYLRLERALLRASSAVVAITDDFIPLCQSAGVADRAMHVIPNWAPLAEVPVMAKSNRWSTRENLAETFNFLYSGTLGMKHNPQLLVELALHLRPADKVRLIVISEGLGADYLARAKRQHALDHLILLPFQPYAWMPQILGAADVLVALLEPSAGVFAVPSKVLTYLCAGRPLLLAVPPENLAARIVREQEAGIVVAPDDRAGFLAGARRLLDEPALRERLARKGRAYAEANFDIDRIRDRFETVLAGCGA